MRHLIRALAASAIALGTISTPAVAAQPQPKSFTVVMSAAMEVPACAAATSAARGVAVFHVTDATAGTVEWKLVANNLPGTITAAHIHKAAKGVPGPVVQPLPPRPGAEHGVIGSGTFTNPGLLAALRADPGTYYVNVHSTVCPSGVIRGQFR